MMENKNSVFIATSMDGYIADQEGGIDWLHAIPNPDQIDMGYQAFMSGIDALVMGRTTFETVCGFDIPWPYTKPVFVLSRSLRSIPESLAGKAFLVHGNLGEIEAQIRNLGYRRLYIDGGQTIQAFLREDRIDELIITTIPVLLGDGTSLFGQLSEPLHFRCTDTTIYLEQVVQSRFIRIR